MSLYEWSLCYLFLFANPAMKRGTTLRRDRSTVAAFFTLMAVSCALLLTVLTPESRQSEYTWSQSAGDLPGSLNLSRLWPELVTVDFDCNAIASEHQGVIVSLGGFTLSHEERLLRLEVRNEQSTRLFVKPPTSNCSAGFMFDSKSGEISVFAGDARSSTTLTRDEYPTIDSIFVGAPDETSDLRVQLLTQPWGLKNEPSRQFLAAWAVLSALLSSMVLSRPRERITNSGADSTSSSDGSSLFVAVCLLASSILIPPFLDDGWVLNRLTQLSKTGQNSNIFDAGDAWLPQGNLHESLLALMTRSGISFIGLRLVVVGLLVVAWELIRRFLLVRYLEVGKPAIWIASAVFTTFSIGWLVTLRAEPWIVLFAAVSWSGLTCFLSSSSLRGFFFALTGAGLAITAHQAGWTALAPAIFGIVIAVRRTKNGSLRIRSLALTMLNATSVIAVSLCFLAGLPTIAESVSNFEANTTTHSYSIFSELLRYQYLFSLASSVRVTSILILLLAMILSAVRTVPSLSKESITWVIAVGSLLGLLLTSSKWLWHFGAYAVPASVFTGLAFSKTSIKNFSKRPIFSISLPVLVFIAASTLSFAAEWGQSDLVSSSWLEFADRFSGPTNVSVWLLISLLALVLGLLADFRREGGFRVIATATTVLSVLCVPILALGWIARDAIRTEGWSYPKQNVQTLTGSSDCDDKRFFAGLEPLPVLPEVVPVNVGLAKGAAPDIPSLLSNKPADFWGSWSIDLAQSSADQSAVTADSATGGFNSPKQQLTGVLRTSFWIASGSSSEVDFSVVLINENKTVDSITVRSTIDATWELVSLEVDPVVTEAFVRVNDRSEKIGGWGAVSALSAPTLMSANEINEAGTVYVGPFEAMRYPCLEPGLPEGGLWPHFDFVTEEATYFSYLFGQDARLTDLGCADPQITCIRTTEYQMATVHRRDL